MEKLDKYLEKAKDLAEDAGEMAKDFAEDFVDRAKDLADEGSKVRELKQSAKEQAASLTLGVKEKVQGAMQDARAAKEIRQGITELENLPEIEGSILYTMEHQSAVSYLNSLLLILEDNRLDDASVVEEIRKVAEKVTPAADSGTEETDEQKAIKSVKSIVFDACIRALDALAV